MVHQAQLAFKTGLILLAVCVLPGTAIKPVQHIAAYNDKAVTCIANTWYYHDTLFNGAIYCLFNNGDTMFNMILKNGLIDGTVKRWFPGHKLQQLTTYSNGSRQGEQVSWWPGGSLKSKFNYNRDVLNGAATEWYSNGALYRQMNYSMGYEKGLQRMWNIKGVLTANYEMHDGRKYGLTGVRRCSNGFDDKPGQDVTPNKK